MKNELETRCSRIFIDHYGIVHNVHKKDAAIELADAKEDISKTRSITNNRKFVILVDMRTHYSIDPKAQNFFGTPEAATNTIALALLVKTAIIRDAGNFYLSTIKINHPTKYFTSKDDAYLWLKKFLDKEAADLPSFKIFKGPDDIIRLTIKTVMTETGDAVSKISETIEELASFGKLPLLIDLIKVKGQDKSSYYPLSEITSSKNIKACAMLIEASQNEIISGLYHDAAANTVLPKVFFSGEDAICWLQEQ